MSAEQKLKFLDKGTLGQLAQDGDGKRGVLTICLSNVFRSQFVSKFESSGYVVMGPWMGVEERLV